jgi:hypothetical protein
VEVRDELSVLPDDSAAREGLADRAERLAEIVAAFIPTWGLWQSHRDRPELDPRTCYSEGDHATAASADDVLRCLLRKRRLLEGLPLAAAALRMELFMAFRTLGRVPDVLWKPFDELPARALERRVRMFDWWVALAAGLVTLLAYLLTIYDNNFGTPSDYAKTFVAGFLGQLAGAAVAWNLFPPFRSYRATRTSPAKPAEAA